MNGAGEKRKRAESAYNTRESMVKNREKKIKSFPFVSSKDRGSDESQRLPTASNEDEAKGERENGVQRDSPLVAPFEFRSVPSRKQTAVQYRVQASKRTRDYSQFRNVHGLSGENLSSTLSTRRTCGRARLSNYKTSRPEKLLR